MPPKTKSNKTIKDDNKTLEKKWGSSVLETGWTGIPNILIERQRALNLSSTEINILLILLKFWWDSDQPPFPSKATIAEMINREESTIRRNMASLEKKGLIQRKSVYQEKGGQTSNEYILDGLVSTLKKESESLQKLKNERKEEDARLRRGIK